MSTGIRWCLSLSLFTVAVFCLLHCHKGVDEQSCYQEVMKILDDYDGFSPDLQRAEDLIIELFKLKKNSALAYVGQGRLTYKSGYLNGDNFDNISLSKAAEYFDKAIEIQPDFFDAHYYGAYPFIFLKDPKSALKYADNAKELDPSSPKVTLLFAEIARVEKDVDKTELLAREILTESNDTSLLAEARSLLIWVCKSQKKFETAEIHYKAIIDLKQNAWSMSNYSGFLNTRGRFDESIHYARQALRHMDFGMAHHNLSNAFYGKAADLCWKKRWYLSAAEYFDSSIQHDQTNGNAYYGLGLCHYHIGYDQKNITQLKKAREVLTEAITLNPDLRQARSTLENLQKLLDCVGQ